MDKEIVQNTTPQQQKVVHAQTSIEEQAISQRRLSDQSGKDGVSPTGSAAANPKLRPSPLLDMKNLQSALPPLQPVPTYTSIDCSPVVATSQQSGAFTMPHYTSDAAIEFSEASALGNRDSENEPNHHTDPRDSVT